MTNLSIGDIAPKFSTIISKNKVLNSSDLAEKYIVLYFYPRDNTPGCTMESKDFNSLYSEFQSLGAEIIGVSKDTVESHENFKNKYELKFPLGSDNEGELCEQYGVWVQKSMFGKKYMGIKRTTFLIAPQGKIAYIWPSVSVLGHASKVLKQLKQIKTV
ncbi:MAG: peroxiredoxin [Rickettsiaceae bacterium]